MHARFASGEALCVVSCEEVAGGRPRFREMLDALEGCESGITLGGVSQESENDLRWRGGGGVFDEWEGAVFGLGTNGVRSTWMLAGCRTLDPRLGRNWVPVDFR